MLFSELSASTLALLGETTGSTWYSSVLLLAAANECMKQLSLQLPVLTATAYTSVSRQAGYSLPADLVSVEAVEHPIGYLRLLAPTPIVGAPQSSWAQNVLYAEVLPTSLVEMERKFYVSGHSLYLSPAPASTNEPINLWYHRARAAVTTATAAAMDLSLGEDILMGTYVMGCCLRAKESQDSNLSRFTEGQKRDDNPLRASAAEMFRKFDKLVKQQQEDAASAPIELFHRGYGRGRRSDFYL